MASDYPVPRCICEECEIGKANNCPRFTGDDYYYAWKEAMGLWRPDYCTYKPSDMDDPDRLPF